MEKVSVIIPIYKVEKYLRGCIDSVLAQTYTNLEIILVDDGSPDSCGAICDEYLHKDSRIRVIHQQNKGLPGARNAGLEICTGAYIAFVDSDDVISPYFVEFLKRAIDEHDADISYCGFRRFHDGEQEITDAGRYEDQEVLSCSGWEALENLFSIWFQPNVWNKLIKRSIMLQFRFPEVCRAEDLAIAYHLLTKANRVAGLKKCQLYHYRFTSGSALSKINEKAVQAELDVRLRVFLELFWGQHEITAIKFANQTRRMYLDFALSNRIAANREYAKVLRTYAKLLCKQMWFPTAGKLGTRLDYAVLYCSVRAWVWLQLIKYKLFKIPLYYN